MGGGAGRRRERDPDDPDGDPDAVGDGLLERWMAHHEEQQDPDREPTGAGGAGDADWWGSAQTVAAPPPRPRTPEPARPPGPASPGARADLDFPPRRGTRRVLALAVLLMLVATAGAAWQVREEADPESVTLLACLAALTLFAWAVRAGSAQTRLSVRGGQLEVRTGGRRTTFDLSSAHTPIEVIGRPGRRGWKVVFGRGSMRPFTVDAGLVDPHAFMRVLRQYRPE